MTKWKDILIACIRAFVIFVIKVAITPIVFILGGIIGALVCSFGSAVLLFNDDLRNQLITGQRVIDASLKDHVDE